MKQSIRKLLCTLLVIGILMSSSMMAFGATAGDVNSDGKVNSTDALAILQYTVGKSPSKFDKGVADMNGDGNINSTDALVALKISVGLISPGENNEDPLKFDKSQLVEYYNSCLKKSYSSDVEVMKSESGGVYNYSLLEGSSSYMIDMFLEVLVPKKSKTLKIESFVNGKATSNDSPIDSFVLPANLYDDAVKSIYIRPDAQGYKLEILLNPEMCRYDETAEYNASCMYPLDIESVTNDTLSVYDGDIYYEGTKITATIDRHSRVTSLYTVMPFGIEYLKIKFPLVGERTFTSINGVYTGTYSLSYNTNPDGTQPDPPAFRYSNDGQCLIATNDIIFQRNLAHSNIEDVSLYPEPIITCDTLPVRFEYDGYEWLIQYCKGQYILNMFELMGVEIGIYRRPIGSSEDTPFERVEDETKFLQSLDVYYQSYENSSENYNLIFSINPSYTTWCTGFLNGALGNGSYYDNPSVVDELKIDSKITFESPEMAQAFVEALKQVKRSYFYYASYVDDNIFRVAEMSSAEEFESSTRDGKFLLEDDSVTVRVGWR